MKNLLFLLPILVSVFVHFFAHAATPTSDRMAVEAGVRTEHPASRQISFRLLVRLRGKINCLESLGLEGIHKKNYNFCNNVNVKITL